MCSKLTPPKRFEILQNFLYRLIALPQDCAFFRSAPNISDWPIKCISAYELRNISFRINFGEYIFVLRQTAESA